MDNETKNIENITLKNINLIAFPDVGKLAFRYRIALTEQEAGIKLLWTFLRGERQGDKFIPYLLPECAESLEAISSTSAKLSEIMEDFEAFKKVMGEFHTIHEMNECKRRHIIKLENADYAARVDLEKALVNNRNLSAQEVENLDAVKKQNMKAKRLHEESDEVIKTLQHRIQTAQKILEKY